MSLKPFSCLVVLCFVVTSHRAVSAQDKSSPQDQSKRARSTIRRFDKDSDNKIAKDEANGLLKRNFNRVDTNSDGLVDEKELKAVFARQRGGGNRTQRAPKVPNNVVLTEDIEYRKGDPKWKLDLMLPKTNSKQSRAAVVFIHGGGWRGGDKGGGQWRSLPLEYASRGYVCVSVNYRLGEGVIPCIEDCMCAVRWLRANAKKYNIDPKRIGGYGNSAGAHLVATLGLAGPNAGLEGDGPYKEYSSKLQAVCCSATPANFTKWGDRSGDQLATMHKRMFPGKTDTSAARARNASPVAHAKGKTPPPPFLIIHGTADKTVPFSQGQSLHAALKKAGSKDVTFTKFEGAGHGVFGQHSKETKPAMRKFFARTLRETGKSR